MSFLSQIFWYCCGATIKVKKFMWILELKQMKIERERRYLHSLPLLRMFSFLISLRIYSYV